jgi:hypothetical protein
MESDMTFLGYKAKPNRQEGVSAHVEKRMLPPEGSVRFYHGAKSGKAPVGEPRWVSDDLKYAQGYATDTGKVFSTDIPKNHPILENKETSMDTEFTGMKTTYAHFEVPKELANWKELVI